MVFSRLKILAKTFAKVNPRLKVLGKLDDGYHELDISFLSITLADRMTFQSSGHGDIRLMTEADISPEENLCYRAARKLRRTCSVDQGADIYLEKRIPIGGGLGGGSSDAATTLICLNRLWDCNLSRRELVEIGEEFGADVPFFFYGGYCVGKGKGSELRKKGNVFRDRFIPLILPPFPQLTSEVYARFDKLTNRTDKRPPRGDSESGPLLGGDLTIENDLQQASLELNPELEKYLDLFEKAATVESAGVAGSGSSIFGISCKDTSPGDIEEELNEGLSAISEEAKLIVTRPTNLGQMIREQGKLYAGND